MLIYFRYIPIYHRYIPIFPIYLPYFYRYFRYISEILPIFPIYLRYFEVKNQPHARVFYLPKFRRNFGLIPVYRRNIADISRFFSIFPRNDFWWQKSLRTRPISDISPIYRNFQSLAYTSNQNQRAWEEGRFTTETNKDLERDRTDLVKQRNERCRVGSKIL